MLRKRKVRSDQLLQERGLAESRVKAQALIMAGQVFVDGQRVDKAGALAPSEAKIEVRGHPRFVGRGGEKLEHALGTFGLEVSGLTALDVGASTGGFTDCMVQRGAARVYALDVGRGLIDYKLRQDPRVVVMEGVNAHRVFELTEVVAVAVVDVSFISLNKVLPNVLPHVLADGHVICLVKPQFEAGRDQVPRGGIVHDPLVHAAVVGDVALWAIGQGLRVRGVTPSPIYGDKGNREFLLHLQKE